MPGVKGRGLDRGHNKDMSPALPGSTPGCTGARGSNEFQNYGFPWVVGAGVYADSSSSNDQYIDR